MKPDIGRIISGGGYDDATYLFTVWNQSSCLLTVLLKMASGVSNILIKKKFPEVLSDNRFELSVEREIIPKKYLYQKVFSKYIKTSSCMIVQP